MASQAAKSASRNAASAPHPPGPPSIRVILLLVLGLTAFLFALHRDVLSLPFVNDDYFFLEKTQHASFVSLWGFDTLYFHWFRPWSREFHYWILQAVFGTNVLAYHLANWLLWLVSMLLYFDVLRRMVCTRTASFAVAGSRGWPCGEGR